MVRKYINEIYYTENDCLHCDYEKLSRLLLEELAKEKLSNEENLETRILIWPEDRLNFGLLKKIDDETVMTEILSDIKEKSTKRWSGQVEFMLELLKIEESATFVEFNSLGEIFIPTFPETVVSNATVFNETKKVEEEKEEKEEKEKEETKFIIKCGQFSICRKVDGENQWICWDKNYLPNYLFLQNGIPSKQFMGALRSPL
jgi:hypothetical protein